MEQWQKNLIQEKAAADQRLDEYRAHINGPIFQQQDVNDQHWLHMSVEYLENYSRVLGERIKRF